jgi:hypothetical protein
MFSVDYATENPQKGLGSLETSAYYGQTGRTGE